MFPLLPLAVGATVAGVCFTVGKKIANSYLIPWTGDAVDGLNKRWTESNETFRKRQLDEIDPESMEKSTKK